MSEPRALNCRTANHALESTSRLLSVPTGELKRRLLEFNFHEHVRTLPEGHADYEETVWKQVVGEGISVTPPETVWFHATRVMRNVDFKAQGLLPPKQCWGRIRRMVEGIARELGFEEAQRGRLGFSYLSKLERMETHGPCAFLLRDAALGRGRSRNFLKCPEIVEDVAQELGGDRFQEILEVFRRGTTPCVVVFRSTSARSDVVPSALAYCHAALHGSLNPLHHGTCFDGRGVAIRPEDVLAVEWLDA